MKVVVLIALSVALVGCEKALPEDPRDAEIAALRADLAVAEMNAVPIVSPAPTASEAFELVVTWPEDSGANYQRTYADFSRCQAAREMVFAENERREADNQAQVGTVLEGGAQIVAAGRIPTASAVCIPV